MRNRLSFVVGVAVGYVLGARAGRERYEQLRKAAQQIAQNPAVQDAVRNTRHAVGSAATRVGDTLATAAGSRLPRGATERIGFLRERTAKDDWGSGG